jgi:hypothetical protein
MRIPLALFSLTPANMGIYYVKHNMGLESWVGRVT